jgi:hypothetical protein
METLLEIIKITMPALIVFLTIYVLMKYHYNKIYTLESMKLKKESTKTTLPLRLQAYERLALFCERIAPENLLIRFRTKAMTGKELENILILAIKQEFDHNLTQQIYVSESLWNIIEMCKNQIIETISIAGNAKNANDPNEFSEIVLKAIDEKNPVEMALIAIRKEVEIYFD